MDQNLTEKGMAGKNIPVSILDLATIIQGDHGYRFYDDRRKNDEFPNFFAVYFSNKDYRHVPDTLSNVNVFKAVLNTYFRQQIPFESNKHFFLR